jgi:hypothetical protein
MQKIERTMQKIFAKCLIGAVCVALLAGPAVAQRLHGGGSGGSGWSVLTYTDLGGPFPQPVTAIKGGGVSFDFYNTPDRAVLINDVTNAKQFKPGTLTGRSLSATIAISATTGATFNYYNNDGTGLLLGGIADAGGFVRLYFQRPNDTAYTDPSTNYHCTDPTISDPTKPRCEAQYWWSNPVHAELIDLVTAGKKGQALTLQVPLSPEFWSDRMGTMGNASADAIAWFNDAVTNANKMGLSFGGDGWWAFGCGVTNGPQNPNYSAAGKAAYPGGSAKATFLLYSFGAK